MAFSPSGRITLTIIRCVKIDFIRRLIQVQRTGSLLGDASWRLLDQPELRIRMSSSASGFICSERRLCEEVHLNLAHRWFCRLGLDGDVPDRQSTRLQEQTMGASCERPLRSLLETVVTRAGRGIVEAQLLAVDASDRSDRYRRQAFVGRQRSRSTWSQQSQNICRSSMMRPLKWAELAEPKVISPTDPAAPVTPLRPTLSPVTAHLDNHSSIRSMQ